MDAAPPRPRIPPVTARIQIEEHPLLDAGAFVARYPAPLGELATPAEILALHDASADAPVQRTEDVRAAVRDLLRHAGYRPTGRGKPSSEYLVRAAGEAGLPRINPAVDACNAVSLHSGLPISVVDLDLVTPPLSIAAARAGASYVFNPSGQEIRLEGLLCLHDAEGPCANAVKDSQRTKTHPGTRTVLSVVWGTHTLPDHTATTVTWYRTLLERSGVPTDPTELR